RSNNRWRDFLIESAQNVAAKRFNVISRTRDACERFFDTFEFTDAHTKLFTNHRVRAANASDEFCAASRLTRKTDTATSSQAFHQHFPTTTDTVEATNDGFFGFYDNIVTFGRTVVEWNAKWIMATADDHTFKIRWNERASD